MHSPELERYLAIVRSIINKTTNIIVLGFWVQFSVFGIGEFIDRWGKDKSYNLVSFLSFTSLPENRKQNPFFETFLRTDFFYNLFLKKII